MHRLRQLLHRFALISVSYGLLCALGAVAMGGSRDFLWNWVGFLLLGKFVYALFLGGAVLGVVVKPSARKLTSMMSEPMLAGPQVNERGEPMSHGMSYTGRALGQSDPWHDPF